jgi:hypothetical protein
VSANFEEQAKMLQKYTVAIVTAADETAEVYLGSCIRGYVMAVVYTKGTLHANTDIVVSCETTGVAILTDSPSANETFHPRAPANHSGTGAAETAGTELIPVCSERIKVTVAQGGAAGAAGSITVIVDEEV